MKSIISSDIDQLATLIVPRALMEMEPGVGTWAALEVLAERGGCWIRGAEVARDCWWAHTALESAGVGIIYTDAAMGTPSLDMIIATAEHPAVMYALSSIRFYRALGRTAPISDAWWGGILRRWLEPATHRAISVPHLGPGLMISERAVAVPSSQIP